jgi:hypothetical protein
MSTVPIGIGMPDKISEIPVFRKRDGYGNQTASEHPAAMQNALLRNKTRAQHYQKGRRDNTFRK